MNDTQPTGLQLAISLLAQIGDDDSDAAIAAVHDLAEAHAQRLTLQHHAADQVWRIADLEVKCVTLKELHDAATDERDELRARLAEIEAQEPVALVETSGDQGAGIGWSGAAQPVGAKLYARPVPAQAVPMSDERIDAIAELVIKGMPDGICGFMRTWGYQQFARALLEVCAGHYRAQAVPDEHAVRTGFRSYDGSGWAATATPWQIWRDAVKWAGGHSTAPEHKE